MKKDKVIEGLEDLLRDRESFLNHKDDAVKDDDIYRQDIKVLTEAIRIIKGGIIDV